MSEIRSDHADDPWLMVSSGAPGQAFPQAPAAPLVSWLDGVVPLDLQPGQWPRRSVPEALRDTVLGPDGLQGYAILDAGLIPNLELRLSEREPKSACLFSGGSAETLGNVAPWLVELAEGDEMTRAIFTRDPEHLPTADPDRPVRKGPWLWDSGAMILLRSDLGFDEVRRRLRKLTRVQDAQGKWMLLRFWDPVFARCLLDCGSDQLRARLLAAGPVMMPGRHEDEGRLRIWTPSPGAPPPQAGPVVLGPEDHRALQIATFDEFISRVLDWLIPAYGPLPDGFEMRRFLSELCWHARSRLGLRSEREVSDYLAASWLLRRAAETVLDFTPLIHEIPQATLARIHDTAYDLARSAPAQSDLSRKTPEETV